ncbi:MAG: AMIN-like domain-containing (lipo)protein [Aridibacter sp.]
MKKAIIIFSIICLTAISISAQFDNEGKLNVWTTENVQRSYWQDFEDEDVASALCKVRTSKHKGFDRVVFEFDDGKHQYVIKYLDSNIYSTDGGDSKIKIAGDVFMLVSIYGMGALDDLPCELKNYPKKKLNFPALMQIQEAAWFEGIQDFIIGVKGKKSFRVQELRNPSRLVIDFKH